MELILCWETPSWPQNSQIASNQRRHQLHANATTMMNRRVTIQCLLAFFINAHLGNAATFEFGTTVQEVTVSMSSEDDEN
jgi:hypothetical protein